MTDKCCLCSEDSSTTIKEGNPKYIGKPVCKDCNDSRKQLFREEGWNMATGFWRKK